MNLGIDFGSTYSMISYYNPVDDTIQAVQQMNGSKYIPSIACYDYTGDMLTGGAVQTILAANTNRDVYRAFKMLLPECDKEKLKKRGYNDEITPRMVTKEFLKQQINIAKDFCSVDRFKNVVICVPASWNDKLYTMSGKAILRDICRELDMMDSVQVISEPAAASAYFAYNYNRNTKKLYDGLILIVDYGGGTLDITLTKVTTVKNKEGVQSMEIDVLGQTGAGENHGDKIGDAGIAYIEGVLKIAIEKSGLPAPKYDGNFLIAYNILESAIINKAHDLSKRLSRDYAGVAERMADDHSLFTKVPYTGKNGTIEITYSMLYEAYNTLIRPVLKKELDRINNEFLKYEKIDPKVSVNGFKIALVGGFGKFFLVQRQVWDYFCISDINSDARLQDTSYSSRNQRGGLTESGKEDAISFGAALISSGIITMRKTAKLSIGLFSKLDGKDNFDFAIKYREELEYDKIYYINKQYMYGGKGSMDPNKPTWTFAIGQGRNYDRASKMIPLKEKQELLEQKISAGKYTFGFSMDDCEVYTFHMVPIDIETGTKQENKALRLCLGNFADIFGSNVLEDEKNIFYKS